MRAESTLVEIERPGLRIKCDQSFEPQIFVIVTVETADGQLARMGYASRWGCVAPLVNAWLAELAGGDK